MRSEYDEIEYQSYSNAFYGGYNDPELSHDELSQDAVIPEYEKVISDKKRCLETDKKQLSLLKKYGVVSVLSTLQTAETLRRLYSDRRSAIDHLSGKPSGTHGKGRAEYGVVNINRDIKALKSKMKAGDWAICRAWGYEKEE